MATYRTAGEPIRQKVNQYQDDPIQNRSMTDQCWNGSHRGSGNPCSGWKEKCAVCDNRRCNANDCTCDCHGPCECLCHKAERKSTTSRAKQQEQTMDIMDSGCGTIDIK